MQDTPQEAMIGDKAARELLVREKLLNACKLWVEYDSTDHEESITMMLNYADALAAAKDAIKECEAL